MSNTEQKEAPNANAASQNSGKPEQNKANENGHHGPIMQARNKTGTVKWFSFKNGYGFITVDGDGDDIFVHRSEFIREGPREVFYHVEVGDRMEFDIIQRAKGREAVAVTGPDGMRIPGSPANWRGRPRRGQRAGDRGDARNESDQYEDAVDEQSDNNANATNGKKKGSGGRRRNVSDVHDGNGAAPEGGDAAGAKGGRRRPRKERAYRRGKGGDAPADNGASDGAGQAAEPAKL